MTVPLEGPVCLFSSVESSFCDGDFRFPVPRSGASEMGVWLALWMGGERQSCSCHLVSFG